MAEDFPETSWHLLADASRSDDAASQALDEFIRLYYGPVISFIRVIVHDDDLASELTHEFFQERVLKNGAILKQASADRGRFRAFIKQSIRNFLIDRHRVGARSVRTTSLGSQEEEWDRSIADRSLLAEEALLRDWGKLLVREAISKVQASCDAKGQHKHFAMFAMRHLSNPDDPPSFRDVGRRFDLDERQARNHVETVANRFRAVLRELVMGDAGSTADFRQELLNLLALL